jgi:hypothetical protein
MSNGGSDFRYSKVRLWFLLKRVQHHATLVPLLEQRGAIVQKAVTTETSLLICEDPDSNTLKLKKARAAGITIMSYDDVFEMPEPANDNEVSVASSRV